MIGNEKIITHNILYLLTNLVFKDLISNFSLGFKNSTKKYFVLNVFLKI